MNKEEFLKELKESLEGLPSEEIENAINYYTEYFEDAEIDDETDVTVSLGTAKEVAKQIISDYSSRDSEEIIKVNLNKDNENKYKNEYFPQEENNKKGKRNKWLIALIIILAILASPIILGLAFGAIGILIGVVVTLFAVVISIIFAGVGCILGGIISVIGSLFVLSQVGISTVILFIGLALISVGIGIILLWLSIKGVKLIIYGCKKIIEKIKRRGGRDE